MCLAVKKTQLFWTRLSKKKMMGKKAGETVGSFGGHGTGVAFTLVDGGHSRVLAEECTQITL